MTVFENVAFGLKLQKLPKNEIRERVEHMLALVKLTGMDKRYPRQLSGGQQQRVALARALVTRPSILLLDEPLSNLDAKLRVEMQVEIKRIQKELGITTIIVTHDHEEAVSLADRVIVMNAGHILQIGKPQEVFDRPASPFIADFMGFSTFLHGIAAGAEGDMRLIRCGAHTLQVPAEAAQELTEGDACILAIRSENIRTAEQEGVSYRPHRQSANLRAIPPGWRSPAVLRKWYIPLSTNMRTCRRAVKFCFTSPPSISVYIKTSNKIWRM